MAVSPFIKVVEIKEIVFTLYCIIFLLPVFKV